MSVDSGLLRRRARPAAAGGRLPALEPGAAPARCRCGLFVGSRGALDVRRRLAAGSPLGLEELVWRGVALVALALSLSVAALSSTPAFAVWHWPRSAAGARVHVVTGLGFGGAFLVGGLVAAILAHAIYNVLVDWAVHGERRRGS